MSQDTKIKRADLGDLGVLAPMFDAYRQFYGQTTDLTGAENFLRQRLDESESVIFLALYANAGVGFAQLYPTFTSVGMKRKWILNDLFVVSDQRRTGVGRALMNSAKDFAYETGAQGLVLETQKINLAAQALYESLGWIRQKDFYRLRSILT